MEKKLILSGLLLLSITQNCFASGKSTTTEAEHAKPVCVPAYVLVTKNQQNQKLILIQIRNPQVEESMTKFKNVTTVESVTACPLKDGSMVVIPGDSEIFK